jgi:hypothetical protein
MEPLDTCRVADSTGTSSFRVTAAATVGMYEVA